MNNEMYARHININDLNISPNIKKELLDKGIRNLENLFDSVYSTLRINYLADDDEFNEILRVINSINYTINNKGNYVIEDTSKLELRKK